MAINPNIKKKADDIRTKVYGREVRESLASGLEEMSSDVVETVGRQDEVESQWQDVIENTTDKDVISAPEIISARDGEANLKARLDKDRNEVTEQIAQTEYGLQEDIQNIDSNLTEHKNERLIHRPIHTGGEQPTSEIGDDGDIYLQTYDGNEPYFYEEGTFTPVITTPNSTVTADITLTQAEGFYTKIGNFVHVQVIVEVGSVSYDEDFLALFRFIPYSSSIRQSNSIGGVIQNVSDRFASPLTWNTYITQGLGGIYLRANSSATPLGFNRMNMSDLEPGTKFDFSFSFLATDRIVAPVNVVKEVTK